MAAGFTVTCPSNSSAEWYPHNNGSNFTMKLHKPIELADRSPNGSLRWQVAMLSIHYTHNFINFRVPCTLRIVIDMPLESQINAGVSSSSSCVAIESFAINEYGMDEADKNLAIWTRKLALLPANRRDEKPKPMLYGKLFLPARHYSSAAEVMDDLVSQCNHIFGPRYNVQFHKTQYADGTVQVALRDASTVTIYSDSEYIAQTLGLASVEDTIPCSGTDTITLYKVEPRGVRIPRLETVQALYVYTDIIEYQHVGDKRAPLLAYVNVQRSPGERVTTLFNPPIYLPVCKSVIDTITIQLCDERGEDAKFPVGGDNVLVVLHFRPVCDQPRI